MTKRLLEITCELNDFLSEFSNVTLFKKWGRFTLPAKKSHVKEGDDNSGKILALLGGCDRNTLKKWRANVRTARRLYLVSPASALIGAVLLCGMIEEVMHLSCLQPSS